VWQRENNRVRKRENIRVRGREKMDIVCLFWPQRDQAHVLLSAQLGSPALLLSYPSPTGLAK